MNCVFHHMSVAPSNPELIVLANDLKWWDCRGWDETFPDRMWVKIRRFAVSTYFNY